MAPHEHGADPHAFDWDAMAAFAEADAEVLTPFLDEAMSALAGAASQGELDVRRILDIGSGPGVSTCRLVQQFDGATAIAADGSAEMLARAAARAARLGLADRVSTRVIDLPDGLDDLGSAELVWASMVLHHVGDEAGALRRLRARLDAGGLLALVEFGDPLRVLPPGAGELGQWERLEAAGAVWMREMRAGLPGAAVSEDYPDMLAGAGFEVLVDRQVDVHLDPPLDDRARQVAVNYLERMRRHVDPYADPADLALLDRLIDPDGPEGVLHRPDALLHVSRHLYVARAV